MDTQRIREIRERLQATTPGAWIPWSPDRKNVPAQAVKVKGTAEFVCVASFYGDFDASSRNAEFIAHAKEDIQFLLDLLNDAGFLADTQGVTL